MQGDPALGAMWYVAFLLSITCHEAAHALAAYVGGDDTAFEEGQVTLNPGPHIKREPFGTVVAPILTFLMNGWMLGWASAPIDPRWQDRYPRRAALMALAGPLSNLGLAIVTGLVIKAGLSFGYFVIPQSVTLANIVEGSNPGLAAAFATFCSILFSLNLILFAFNLLPLPPLDGVSVITLLLPEEHARTVLSAAGNPAFAIVGILVAWRVAGFVVRPAILTALGILY